MSIKTKSSLIPELKVFDFKQSLDFYTRLAGFEVLYVRQEDLFAMLEINGAQLMIEGFTNHGRSWITGELEKPLGRGMHFQIEVNDALEVYHTFKKASYPIFLEMEEKGYRINDEEIFHQQFLVQDPDGYLLRFFNKLLT